MGAEFGLRKSLLIGYVSCKAAIETGRFCGVLHSEFVGDMPEEQLFKLLGGVAAKEVMRIDGKWYDVDLYIPGIESAMEFIDGPLVYGYNWLRYAATAYVYLFECVDRIPRGENKNMMAAFVMALGELLDEYED